LLVFALTDPPSTPTFTSTKVTTNSITLNWYLDESENKATGQFESIYDQYPAFTRFVNCVEQW
jgi:hypothetical protein